MNLMDLLNIIIADPDPGNTGPLKALCGAIPGVQVMGVAHSTEVLSAKLNQRYADLVLLTISPKMGGTDVVETLKKIDPDLNLVVMYRSDDHNSDALIDALEAGAYECLELPDIGDDRQLGELRLRLLTLTGLLRSRKRFSKDKVKPYKSRFFMPAEPVDRRPAAKSLPRKIDVVVMASSTGGPEILSRIFSILPGNLKVPVLLVQHIPEKITRYFAKSLDEKSELKIQLSGHGDEILPARVYLAPGGQHMTVSRPNADGRRTIILDSSAPVNSVRPSADLLFKSIAESYQGNVLAVVLTGMGEDGKEGVAALKRVGCYCITQNAETCVVYGMPRAVDEAGFSDERLDPLSITQRIVNLVQ